MKRKRGGGGRRGGKRGLKVSAILLIYKNKTSPSPEKVNSKVLCFTSSFLWYLIRSWGERSERQLRLRKRSEPRRKRTMSAPLANPEILPQIILTLTNPESLKVYVVGQHTTDSLG